MDYDVWILEDNIRRYRELLRREKNVMSRAKLEGLIMAEEDKLAQLSRDQSPLSEATDDEPDLGRRSNFFRPVRKETFQLRTAFLGLFRRL
jgi:hypothetical protein